MNERASGSNPAISPKRRRPIFYPVSSLDDKNNFKRFHRVEGDGSITERVFLDVSDMRAREELICIHYLRFYTRFVTKADTGLNFISRDEPWDFSIELSTGRRFNLEIVSIAEHPLLFEINKREERFNAVRDQERIPLRELAKLLQLFPSDEFKKDVTTALNAGTPKDSLVENPFFAESPVIFVSALPEETQPLDELILNAVTGKSRKTHENKASTILIIDNRTSAYDAPDVEAAVAQINPDIENAPFPEIWFYTGYCSDNDGNRAEFTFFPLKTTDSWAEALSELATSNQLDEYNRYVY